MYIITEIMLYKIKNNLGTFDKILKVQNNK